MTWREVFSSSGLNELIVKDGVTGKLIFHGKRKLKFWRKEI